MKKILIGLIVIVLLSGCVNQTEKIKIDREMTLSEEACTSRGLQDKIIIIASKYCGACQQMVPIIQEIDDEFEYNFKYIDIAEADGQQEYYKLNMDVSYTPTILVGCSAYIGIKEKSVYKQIFEEFITKNNLN